MQRLLRREDFLRVRSGRRVNASCLTLQAKFRESPMSGGLNQAQPRVGFTVTKKEGCAVERNRIRRRLREAVRLHAGCIARDNHDYVVIGRRAALSLSFEAIVNELVTAFGRVHSERHGSGRSGRPVDEAVR